MVRPGPKQSLSIHDLRAANQLFSSEDYRSSTPKAKSKALDTFVSRSSVSSPVCKPAELKRESLQQLQAICDRHGSVTEIDLGVLAQKLGSDASRAVTDLYQELQTLKQTGQLNSFPSNDKVTAEVVQKLEANNLPPKVRTHLLKLAATELLQASCHPTRDVFIQGVLRRLLSTRFKIPERQLATSVPRDIPLRHRNATQTLCLRALLQDTALPVYAKTAFINRLAKVGDESSKEVLTQLAKTDSSKSVQNAAKVALEKIEKSQAMNIVFAAMEARPYAGSGGMGNVLKELPRALAKQGHNVSVILPRHSTIDRNSLKDLGQAASINTPEGEEQFQILSDHSEGVDYYFVENDKFFSANRNGIYGDQYGSYGDNHKRYDFFSAAIPQVLKGLCRPGTRPHSTQ